MALAAAAVAGAAPAAAAQVSITAPAAQDCGIRPETATLCAAGTMHVGMTSRKVYVCSDKCEWKTFPVVNRSLMQFDLSGVPAGSEIVSASLRIWVQSKAGLGIPVEVRPVLGRWTNTATWIDYETFSPWDTAGADVGPPVAGGSITSAGRFYRFDVAGLVREWAGGTRANYGLLMDRVDELDGVTGDAAAITTNEGTTAANRPVLEIVYEPGTPPHASLSGALWDDRDVDLTDDRTDSGWVDTDEGLQVSAGEGAAGAGVASIEMRVDGTRLRPEHLVTQDCASGCPTGSASFVMHRADVPEGEHAITVIVRDTAASPSSATPGAHVTVLRFLASFGDPSTVPDDDLDNVPPPGSAAAASAFRAPLGSAASLLSAKAASDSRTLIASQVATPGSDLADLVRGTAYTIERQGVMSQGVEGTGAPRVVGTVAIVRLAQPVKLETTIRCYAARPDMARIVPYEARVVARALRSLLVRIDSATGAVLCASPGPDSEAIVEPVPGQAPLPAPSED